MSRQVSASQTGPDRDRRTYTCRTRGRKRNTHGMTRGMTHAPWSMSKCVTQHVVNAECDVWRVVCWLDGLNDG
eukprot:4504198-Alexandrium_andersonii.AAC.1